MVIAFIPTNYITFNMEEGREGVRTKGLQKSNLWYRDRLTTPPSHPHTVHKQWATWRMWVCTCALGSSCNYGVVCRMDIIQKKLLCARSRPPKRKTQLSTNHPCVLIPKFCTTASDRKSRKKCKNMLYFHVNTTNGKRRSVYSKFLSPMIQLNTNATVQKGGTTPYVQICTDL